MYLLKNEMRANKMFAEATKLGKRKLLSPELRQKRKSRDLFSSQTYFKFELLLPCQHK